MEWGSKWGEFDNFISFARAEESSRELQFSDLIINNQDLSVGAGSLFSLSMGSNRGHASVTQSSLSASVESFIGDVGGIQSQSFRLMTSEDSHTNSYMEILMKEPQESGLCSSVGAMEPLIGLELGKQTYFENMGTSSSVKPSTPTKTKSSYQKRVPRCIVEGCSADLSSAKGYHRKHRVCEYHSKCFKVLITGVERRFCQQCSRFHNLSEFDDKRRSCRRKLCDHNIRRRKPQLEAYSAALSSSFYGEKEVNFQLIDGSRCHSKQFDSSVWGNTSSSNCKFTLTTGHSTQGSKESSNLSGLEVPMEHFGARSLLSTNYLYSGGVESVPLNFQGMPSAAQPMLHGADENVALSRYGEVLLQGQQASNHPKIHVFEIPYESDFYTTIGFHHS